MIDLGAEFDESLYIIPCVIFNKSRGIYFGYVRVEDYKEIIRGRRQSTSIGVKNVRHVFFYKCEVGHEGTTGLAEHGPMTGSKVSEPKSGISAFTECDKLYMATDAAVERFNGVKW
jgi:hypothetical protein